MAISIYNSITPSESDGNVGLSRREKWSFVMSLTSSGRRSPEHL